MLEPLRDLGTMVTQPMGVPSVFLPALQPAPLPAPAFRAGWHLTQQLPLCSSCKLELLASKNKSKQNQGWGAVLSLLQRPINGLCVGDEANTTWPFVERHLFLCLKSSDTESWKEPQNTGSPAASPLEVCFSSTNRIVSVFVPEVKGRTLCSLSPGARNDRLLERWSTCLFFLP